MATWSTRFPSTDILNRRVGAELLQELDAKRQKVAAFACDDPSMRTVEGDRWERDEHLLTDADWQAKADTVHQIAAAMTAPQAAYVLWDRAARRADLRAPLAYKLNPAPMQPLAEYKVPQQTAADGTLTEFPQWRAWLKPLSVPGADGISLLDAMLIRSPRLAEDAPLLLMSVGSGGAYERSLDVSHALAARHDIQVLVYNYRGVGNSLGKMVYTQDLVADFRCMLDEALRRAPRVAVAGRSMGGGAVSEGLAQLQAEDPERAARVGLCVLENTFSSFSAAAAHVTKTSPVLMGAAYGVLNFQDFTPAAALKRCAPSMQVVVTHIDDDQVIGEAAGLHRVVQPSTQLTLARNLPRAGVLKHTVFTHADATHRALDAWRKSSAGA